MEKYVIDLKKYDGHAKTILYDGVCPYTGVTEADCIKEGLSVLTWDEYEPVYYKYLDSLCGKWSEITEEDYNDALDCLPPLRWHSGGFFIREMYSADVSNFYQQLNDRYFTSMQRLSYNRDQILADLRQHIS